MSTTPVKVAVTGAAGQIGYALLFRIASGEMLGKDQPVILQMLELPMEKAQAALKGVMMELEDCAFPLLAGMVAASDPKVAFKDINVALLVGARPRSKGMERKDLLEANGAIFTAQGRAIAATASDCRCACDCRCASSCMRSTDSRSSCARSPSSCLRLSISAMTASHSSAVPWWRTADTRNQGQFHSRLDRVSRMRFWVALPE